MATDAGSPTTPWTTIRYRAGQRSEHADVLTTEGPVEFRIGGVPIAVLMRTPGSDEALGLGFVITEGIVIGPDEVDSIVLIEGTDHGDRYDVNLADGVVIDPEQFRRNVFASSSCGVCGKASIDAVLVASRTPPSGPIVTPGLISSLPDRLSEAQDQFALTGSLHAAAAFSATGELLAAAEDVGRHNAVDKVVGILASGAWPPGEIILGVSGRIGFEITQKAAVAGIPIVVGVSGASSLAAELGETAGVTVVGFVREDGFNVYSGAERIT
ncbi:MAG: formate dehydrogenase accessory sulfurtransferase FdhD [Armatimonadetes bacterium]|nr:MAG: formate dehydrogenase accessory sulfurtransferase FdhD [Armatimonadota bacterium]